MINLEDNIKENIEFTINLENTIIDNFSHQQTNYKKLQNFLKINHTLDQKTIKI